MNKNSEKLTGIKLYGIMIGMLLAGTLNTLLTKWQNDSVGVPNHMQFGNLTEI